MNEENNSLSRSGSIRKVLPTKPSTTTDSRLSMSMKMIDRPTVSTSNNNWTQMYNPYILEYSIMVEYQMLQKQDLSGVYVIPSEKDPLLWFGVIFVQQGYYQGGIFRFLIKIPPNYLDGVCPEVFFETKLFHPAVNFDSGELNVSAEFHEWRKKMNQLWQVVQYVKRIFFNIETKASLNENAADLLVKDPTTFKEIVKSCVRESKQLVYNATNDDSHYIHFEPYNENIDKQISEKRMPSSAGAPSSSTFNVIKNS